MRFSVTALGRTPHHVVVGAGPDTPIMEAAARIADATSEPDTDLFLGGRQLDPSAPLASAGLYEGAVIGLGARVALPSPKPALLELHAVSGAHAGTIWPLSFGAYPVGSAAGCAIRIDDAPERVAVIAVRADGAVQVTLYEGARLIRVRPPRKQDMAAMNGGKIAWPAEADLEIGGTLLRWAAPADPDSSVEPSEDGVGLDFNRPPRIVEPVARQRYHIPERPSPPGRRPFPLLIVLLPAVLGLGMVWLFHSLFFLVFMVFCPVFALSNWIHDKRHGKKDYRRMSAEYVVEKAQQEHKITIAVASERLLRLAVAADPAAALLTATGPDRRLWERRRSDADHLVLRVGTVDQPSLVEVEDPGHGGRYREPVRWNVPAIPIGVGLADRGVVALAGPPERIRPLACWMAAQAAVEHSPRDVRLVLLTGPDGGDWEWMRWLPHARSPHGRGQILIGNDEETVAHRVSELLGIITRRSEARKSAMSKALFTDPDIVVVVDGARRLRDTPGLVQILTDGPAVRVFSLCIDREVRLLPEEATAVVDDDGDGGVTLRQDGVPEVAGIRPDLIHPGWCDTVARSLAPLRDATLDEGNVLPAEVRLLEMLGLEEPDPEHIAARWLARPASTAAVIGIGYEGPLSVDLASDGPHALIAGTTGSGKSELLQTLVASLAVANRPEELTFLLIDYKGGSAFTDCVHLPHTLGMVTDLDGHLVHRVLESLAAELRRRECLLAEHEAKDHPGYQALRRRDPSLPPLPRLVLIVDEFATLVREVPTFIPGIVSIAQRGRSLGLHLVLATQRPAGVISGDIRANTNLRIALRVLDPTESGDVIDTSDAAAIPPTLPGRALVRLAHRTVAAFQTAYTGAQHTQTLEEATPSWAVEVPWSKAGRQINPPAGPQPAADDTGPTDLAVLVEAIRRAAADLKIEPQQRPWLPPLPARITLAELPQPAPKPGAARDAGMLASNKPFTIGELPLGIDFASAYRSVRDPRPMVALLGLGADETAPVMVDLAGRGHAFMVVGPPGSGRSTTLATLAISLLAARTKLLVITPRESPLRQLAAHPHVQVVTGAAIAAAEVNDALAKLGPPCVVLIDDADLMAYAPAADPALRETIATGRDRGIGLACSGPAETFVQAMGGWLGEIRRVRQSVLLSPQSMSEGDLVGTRIPMDVVRRPMRPGRGYIANTATGGLTAVAIPHTKLRAP
jgi:S-DNA-T family DNA segregation ATPase FtsK/SpoIIIE